MLLLRFWLGQTFELHGEEAYLWALSYGNHLDWGYWDRGIVVPWLMKLGTWFFGDNELGVRWVAAVIYTVTGFLIFWAGRKWFGPRAAFWAVVVYMVTPLYTWRLLLMTDETASLGLMMLALVAYREAVDTDRWHWWIASGLISGVAIHVSWFNGIWPLGLLAFMLRDPERRHRLKEWRTLFVPGFALLAAVPIIAWYQRPEAAGLHLERIQSNAPIVQDSYRLSIGGAMEFIGGQIGLLSPGIFVGLLVAFYLAGSVTFTHRHYALLMWLSLPGILLQVVASFFGVQDEGAMAALYLPALFLAANFWVHFSQRDPIWRWAGVIILVLAGVQSFIGLIPYTRDVTGLDSGVYTRDGLKDLAREVMDRKQEYGAVVVFAGDPETASLVTFYTPQGQAAHVPLGSDVRSQYDFWDPGYEDLVNSRALLVTRGGMPSPAVQRQFEAIEEIPNVLIPGARDVTWRLFVTRKYQSDTTPGHGEDAVPGPGGGVDEDLPMPAPEPSAPEAAPTESAPGEGTPDAVPADAPAREVPPAEAAQPDQQDVP